MLKSKSGRKLGCVLFRPQRRLRGVMIRIPLRLGAFVFDSEFIMSRALVFLFRE
jgi:hypothetical protein